MINVAISRFVGKFLANFASNVLLNACFERPKFSAITICWGQPVFTRPSRDIRCLRRDL
jgi:hypothetical protein